MVYKNFITLEGGEGSGKTTTAKLLKEKLEHLGYKVIVTREPGGTNLAEDIREVILKNDITVEEEALLFAAARINHIKNLIIPHLENDYIVICDRYVDSSIVYQQKVRKCKNVKLYNNYAYENCLPSKTFFFDINAKESINRIKVNSREENRFDKEGLQFHEDIYNAYVELANEEDRILSIDASKNSNEVVEEILNEIKKEIKC